MSVILVVNSGSSSIKYQIIDPATEQRLAKGLIERVGADRATVSHTGPDGVAHEAERPVLDHVAGFETMLQECAAHGPDLDSIPIVAVGHRVVHGGSRFVEPTWITDAVVTAITQLSPLAPLHNPPNLLGINAARTVFPDVPHIAVFDTAFHRTMPPAAYTYAIDARLAAEHRIRRYGFHGTSHKFVSERTAAFLDRSLAEVNTIVLHIGNGVSACAVRGGASIETSMGMTPLEGLVMGTRSGDIDPGILFHLDREAAMPPEQLDTLLNRRSGLLGLSGSADMRDVLAAAHRDDPRAQLAVDVYCHRLRHYVGAYHAQLGRLDAIAFTAGVGENAPEIRARALAGLEPMGIVVDAARNAATNTGPRRISPDDAPVAVLVIPTNEELEIARQTMATIENG